MTSFDAAGEDPVRSRAPDASDAIRRDALRETAAALNDALAGAAPSEIIAAAVRASAPGRLAIVSSFGTESAVLLKHVADVDRSIPVLLLDTGWLFEETLAYRDTLIARLGLRDVRAITPRREAEADPDRDLWFRDPDACCALRKVEPLAHALQAFDGWINGRKRYQGGERAHLPVVEADGTKLKFNPLARSSHEELQRLFAQFDLPRHPLEALGYASIGCMPCTSRRLPGEALRAGRWRGRGKIECGIHAVRPDGPRRNDGRTEDVPRRSRQGDRNAG
jgi:phosphoadenosine phosphosulfate reductase